MATFPTQEDDVLTDTPGSDTIDALGGNDQITVTGGNDVVNGNAGVDTLVVDYSASTAGLNSNVADGNSGASGFFNNRTSAFQVQFQQIERFVVTGTAEGDIIMTGSGNDVVNAGGGDDEVLVGRGVNTADGGAGIDRISADLSDRTAGVFIDLRMPTTAGAFGSYANFEAFGAFTGSAFDDVLIGTAASRDEVLDGGGGNDRITVFAGNDNVDGGAGVDTLVVDYRSTAANVNSGLSVDGDGGFSGFINNGTTASQVAFRRIERFDITTGGGNDTITTGSGDDVIDAGPGNDTLNGGDGIDTLSYQTATGGVAISLSVTAAQITGGAGTDTISNFENLIGSGSGDSLTGNGMANRIEGRAGNDILAGLGGNDDLDGGVGDDTVRGGTGNDTVRVTGPGIDVAEGDADFDALLIDYRDSAMAVSTIINAGASGFDGGYRTGDFSGAGADRSILFRGFERFEIRTGSGSDQIFTPTGNSIVETGSGNDRVEESLREAFTNEVVDLGSGDDEVTFRGGTDAADGGEGRDSITLIYDPGSAAIVNGVAPSGFDLRFEAGARGSVDLKHFEVIRIFLGSGNDVITTGATQDDIREGAFSSGATGDDVLSSGAENDFFDLVNGNDVVDGGDGLDSISIDYEDSAVAVLSVSPPAGFDLRYEAGADRSVSLKGVENIGIRSGSGNDVLTTGAGRDFLTGGAGNDVLDGGAGRDEMRGEGGNDVFLVDDARDIVFEQANEGTDEVRTALPVYRLSANVENLTYTGTTAASLRGNAVNNLISGAGDADTIFLQDGGDDVATGLGGDDGFYFGAALTAADEVDGGEGSLDQVGLQGDYVGLILGAKNLVGIEQLVLLPGSDNRFGDISGALYSYNLTTIDANVGAGQRLVVTFNTLRAGENVTFDGSAETDGTFLTYGGNGADILTGGQGDDGFFFGTAGRFGPGDRVDGQGGIDQLGLQGNYTGANAIVLGANQITGIEMVVLLTGGDARFGNNGVGYSYDLSTHDGNVAAGANLSISANTLRSDETFTFDGSAETDGRYTIFSGDGADNISGGASADEIFGRGGVDTINGGGGADRIVGGLGGDILTGGDGADTFVYAGATESTSLGFDTLIGFDFRVDRVDLPTEALAFSDVVESGRLDGATFDADIAAALNGLLGAGEAAVFIADRGNFAGRIFGIVDANGITGYQAGEDYLFELVDPVVPPDPTTDFFI